MYSQQYGSQLSQQSVFEGAYNDNGIAVYCKQILTDFS
jgi:hypothetical protein